MRTLLAVLVTGLASGSIYALAGMGLSLTFKTSGIVNFAHGAQAALGAFLLFEFRERVGMPWPVAALLSLLLAGVIAGLILERIAAGLASASAGARVAAMVGVLVGVQGLLIAVFGQSLLELRFFLPTHIVHLPGVNVRVEQIIVAAIALGAAGALALFFARTRLGVAMEAVVDDPVLTSVLGTDPGRVRRAAWVIGSCFAAVSGMLIAPTQGLDAGVLTALVFYAFGAAAVGAFTSLPFTYVGGLVIGVGSALITQYLQTTGPLAALPSTLPVIVLFAALLVVPRGWLAEREARLVRPTLAPVRFGTLPTVIAVGVGVVALLFVPRLTGSHVSDWTTAAGFVVMFASLALLVRGSGQVSLCHITFAAVGATTFARVLGAGLPWPLALLAAGLVAAPVGVLVALPAIRLPAAYLGIATIGFGMLVQRLFFGSILMFGGPGTILRARRPALGGSDHGYYYVVLFVAGLCVVAMAAIRRGRLGRLLGAVAEQPVVLDAQGVNSNVTRLVVFALSAFFAGVAGALLAPVTGSVTATSFDFTTSLLLIAVLFIAGRQPIAAPIIASLLFIVGPAYLTSATARDYVPVAFGAAAVIAAIAGGMPFLARLAVSKRTAERARSRPLRTRVSPVGS